MHAALQAVHMDKDIHMYSDSKWCMDILIEEHRAISAQEIVHHGQTAHRAPRHLGGYKCNGDHEVRLVPGDARIWGQLGAAPRGG